MSETTTQAPKASRARGSDESIWRRFFAPSLSDRTHTWQPDVNLIGLGTAVAALAWGYTPAENPSPWDPGLVLLFSVAAGVFLIRGARAKVPTAQVDERWDDRYDELRDQTEAVLPVVSGSFLPIWSQGLRGERTREHWLDYVQRLPIPIPDARPLHEWHYFLSTHESQDVQQFYLFARGAGGIIQVSNFRRYAVRTYHRFGRLHRADAAGFREWFADEGVKDGAEPIVVLLAYLEVARAVQHPTEFPGDGHSGFWYLAERWHPNVMRLPHPTPAAGQASAAPDHA